MASCSLLAFKWSLLYITAEKSLKASPTAFQKPKVNNVVAAVIFFFFLLLLFYFF